MGEYASHGGMESSPSLARLQNCNKMYPVRYPCGAFSYTVRGMVLGREKGEGPLPVARLWEWIPKPQRDAPEIGRGCVPLPPKNNLPKPPRNGKQALCQDCPRKPQELFCWHFCWYLPRSFLENQVFILIFWRCSVPAYDQAITGGCG